MVTPPVFYDPGQRRWMWFKRILVLLLVFGLVMVCGLMVSIISLPVPGGPDELLPQNLDNRGSGIARPGELNQQYQQAVTDLNHLRPSASATVKPAATLVPANPLAAPVIRGTPTFTPSPWLSTPTAGGAKGNPTPTPAAAGATATLAPPTATPGHGRPTPLPTGTPTSTPTPHPGKRLLPQAGVVGKFPGAGASAASLFQPVSAVFPAGSEPGRAWSDGDALASLSTGDLLKVGFYVNWDDNAGLSLKQNLGKINRLVPEWLHLADAGGAILDDDLAKEDQVLELIQQQRPGLAVLPLINSYDNASGQWKSQQLGQMLKDPAARRAAIQALLRFVQKNQLAGISIDFEDAPLDSQEGYQAFMRELYATFHPLQLEVAQVIPLVSTAFKTHLLAESSDELILVAYDEHWSEGKAGPIASQGWFQAGLKSQLSQVDPRKVVIAIGNYGYDWPEGAAGAQTLSVQEALKVASAAKASVAFDGPSQNPTFRYQDAGGKSHSVWFLDAVTAFNQISTGLSEKVGGFAVWRLGSEDPDLWQVMDHLPDLNAGVADGLKTMHYGYGIHYEGQGEVLQIGGLPQSGSREITFDAGKGRISAEKITSFPSVYTITRWGRKEKAIALTFDDGPDPAYTAQVLDVLKKYRLPATFFVIGVNGQQNPGLLHQIVDAGHEIGVHTFTHPDISAISSEQLRLELNATQLLIESELGVHTILFRPPYGIDAEPASPEDARPLVEVSRLGYYTIGMQIDPSDWERPGAQEIVDRTLRQVAETNGNIIILHDGGGDRSQTVAALPGIIEGLQAKGYRFVAVSDLMGIARSQVNPALPSSGSLRSRVGLLGFSIVGWTTSLSSILFFICTLLGIGRMVFITLLAVIQWLRSDRIRGDVNFHPLVSVLVPAYNEAKVIHKTIDSLLKSTYPNFEIVVIDDGSTDGTYERVLAQFPNQPRLRVFTKENGGKAHALNFGIQQALGEIIVVLDADTIILPGAIGSLVRHMADPRVSAVAGNAKVGNRLNMLTQMQALEYITSQNMDRRAFALLNCITVVPGAIGAWRKDRVVQVGGFHRDTLAEDADLTLNVLRTGIRIEYEAGAIALTEAPDNLGSFLKQRFRWMYGMLQTTWKQKDALFRRRYGTLGWVALPNILFFSVFLPLISPIMDLSFLWSIANWAVYRFQHPADLHLDYIAPVLEFYGFFLLVDLISTLLAFTMESREDWRLILWIFPQRFFYRQLMYYTAIKSTLSAIRGQVVGWGKLERKATVILPPPTPPVRPPGPGL